MKIFLKAEDQCDYYCCFDVADDVKISLPENILLRDFLFFLQSSLDQLKYVLIVNNPEGNRDVSQLKGSHFVLEDDFIFLNYSIRNSLKTDGDDPVLSSFDDIRISLGKILKNIFII